LAEIAGWNIDIGRDGRGLPAGSGSVSHGREVFQNQCAACHGDKGQGGIGDRLVGGQGTLASSNPVKTVGSYWPFAPTLFDYIRRAMPQNAPGSLSNEDVYAVSAYILNLNGLLPADAVLDASTMAAIKMPNRRMFVGDSRPDVRNPACEKDC
jgi:S-disulfanyl-L-cysteine oxidoreductase SoxD